MENTIKINGITYKIFRAATVNDIETEGHKNIAANMRENNINRMIYMQRPRGSKFYLVYEFIIRGKTLYSDVISAC